jgi:hypothetical protein
MPSVTGKAFAPPLPRLWVEDLMIAARGVPIISFERTMALAELRDARQALADPPGWACLFAKAYAAVSARRPELRRTHQPYPWPHLWQSDHTVASIAVERQFEGEPAVFFGLIQSAEKLGLIDLQRIVREWQQKPVEHVRPFRKLLRYTRWPRPLRRLAWLYGRDWCGRIRINTFGTFGLSVTAGSGATALNLISPLTTTLNYGMLTEDSHLPVRLHFDHRVLDGANVARILHELDEELHGPILKELVQLQTAPRIRDAVTVSA